jgi:hypothetical protein
VTCRGHPGLEDPANFGPAPADATIGAWRPPHRNASATTSPGSCTADPTCATSPSAPPGSWLARCRSTACAWSRWTRPRTCRRATWSSTVSRPRRPPPWPRSGSLGPARGEPQRGDGGRPRPQRAPPRRQAAPRLRRRAPDRDGRRRCDVGRASRSCAPAIDTTSCPPTRAFCAPWPPISPRVYDARCCSRRSPRSATTTTVNPPFWPCSQPTTRSRLRMPGRDVLAELDEKSPGRALPPVVTAVAGRARSIAHGHAAAGAVARARVRPASGLWLLVRGSTLGDGADAPTAVIIEPARAHEQRPSSPTPTAPQNRTAARGRAPVGSDGWFAPVTAAKRPRPPTRSA